MGGHLLRREILKAKLPLLILTAVMAAIPGSLLSAEEAETANDEPQTTNYELFHRPLRQNREYNYRENPAPPAGAEKCTGNSLLTPAVLKQPLVQQYIRQYSSQGGLSWLSSVMERGGPYLAFIRKEIAERNLPEELVFLPVIESGYLSTALSKSGASGLWQFMKNSMGPFDMKVTEWLDERRDFWKSTRGALRKLEENYKYFGSWPLALAAYNAGLGEINRTVQRGGTRDYWVLAEKKLLKTETAHYVPKLLAAAYILSNQRLFGLEAQWPEDPRWQRIAAERQTDLRILADETGIKFDELKWANRELLHSVTPPGQGYYLKIKGKDAEKAAAVLSRRDITLLNYYFHTIRSGDTLFALALHYGVTVDQIMASNPGIEQRFLKIGSRLLIPALNEKEPYRKPIPALETLNFSGTHLVKKGETLWSIALAYEVDPEILAEANDMSLNDILREGKTLKTPIK